MEDKKKHASRAKKKKKEFLKNEESLGNILDNMKCNNIHIMGIPKGEESEQRIKNLFEETTTKNFLNLVKEKDTQVQEAQRVPQKLDPKMPTLIMMRHIIMNISRLKDKERILKATRKNRELHTKEQQLDLHLISQQKYFRPEGSGMKYSR